MENHLPTLQEMFSKTGNKNHEFNHLTTQLGMNDKKGLKILFNDKKIMHALDETSITRYPNGELHIF